MCAGGGIGQTSFCTTFETELIGRLTLASDGEVLTGCWFEHDRNLERGAAGELVRDDALAAFAPARDWLARYFAGEKPASSGPAHRADGTEFQRAVWAELEHVPYGCVTSYGTLARRLGERLGRQTSARAVGGAVGRNRLCVIVPCHRVVGADGTLTGFAGGLDVKRRLLELEGVDVCRLCDLLAGRAALGGAPALNRQ